MPFVTSNETNFALQVGAHLPPWSSATLAAGPAFQIACVTLDVSMSRSLSPFGSLNSGLAQHSCVSDLVLAACLAVVSLASMEIAPSAICLGTRAAEKRVAPLFGFLVRLPRALRSG